MEISQYTFWQNILWQNADFSQLDLKFILLGSVTHHPIDSVQCCLSERTEIKEIVA